MATPPLLGQASVLEKNLEPWERIAYTAEEEHKMYCVWGTFFSFSQQLDIAAHYYDKALALQGKNPDALYFRSVCRRKIAHTQDALMDALKANVLEPYRPRNNMAVADALNELNEFENALVELAEGKRKYFGSVVNDFLNRIVVIMENLKDSLGDSLQIFFLKHEHLVNSVAEMLRLNKNIDTRPLWKRLKDEEKCDVLSIPDKEELLLSSRERARRERSFRIFYQTYFERSWVDVIFLRNLRDTKTFQIKQFTESTPVLKHSVDSKYKMVKKFLKMLHARSPMYHTNDCKFPDKKLQELQNTKYLNGIQYQTHRCMLTVLRQIKELRAKGRTEQLARYIESVMGDYVVLKTHRIMPWKFEFMNDVYNTLALAFTDRFVVQEALTRKPFQPDTLQHLLKLPTELKDRPVNFEFGNKSTSVGAIGHDNKYDAYKKFISRLERRMLFSRYAIEKAYLWHEAARAHLKEGHFDECYHSARKAIDASSHCKNYLWAFLGQMLIVKSHASFHKIERCGEALNDAYLLAAQLRSENLCLFVDTARQINDEYIYLKQRPRSAETIRKRKLSSMTLISIEDENSNRQSSEPSD